MNTKEFFEALKKDADLQKKFEGVNTPEKFYELARENGLTDDLETMKATAMELIKADALVTEEQLSEISGGYSTETSMIVSYCAVGASAGFAASFAFVAA